MRTRLVFTGTVTYTDIIIATAVHSSYWYTYTYIQCVLYSVSVYAGLSILTVNITKNITNSSIVVQWDAVHDFLLIVYTITWTDGRNLFKVATVEEQTSYTITGLTLDTVYSIAVSAANVYCGSGPEFITSISFSTDTTSTTSTISQPITTVLRSTNPMIIISTSSNATTIALNSPSTIATTTLHVTTVTATVDESSAIIPTAITYPITTNIVNSPVDTTNPADTTTADETSECYTTSY